MNNTLIFEALQTNWKYQKWLNFDNITDCSAAQTLSIYGLTLLGYIFDKSIW